MPVKRMRVHLQDGGVFEAAVGRGAVTRLGRCLEGAPGIRSALVVSDEETAALFEEKVVAELASAGIGAHGFSIPAGRQYRSAEALFGLWEAAEDAGAGADCAVVGLGGNAVCDVAAMLSATYLGGVAYIGVPTTPAAMAQAAAGRCSVDITAEGHGTVSRTVHPAAVICDLTMLDTMPARCYPAGLAVLARNALLGEAEACAWFLSHIDALATHDEDVLSEAIAHDLSTCAKLDAGLGVPGYGEQFAAALLACVPPASVAYGEALGEGIRFSSRLAQGLLGATTAFVESQDRLLDAIGLSRVEGDVAVDALRGAMPLAARTSDDAYTFPLLRAQGDCVQTVVRDETLSLCLDAWAQARGEGGAA